jgi:CBS domain-containing protein
MHGTPHIVSDVMTHTVAAVGREATFKEIVRTMQDWKASALPVLDGDGDGEGRSSASSPRPICCPRRSSATAIPTGTPNCAASPTCRRPARSPRRS